MDSIDPKKAARVWQRVTAGMPPQPPEPLEQLIALEQQAINVCLTLSTTLERKDAAYFRHLAARKQEQAKRLMFLLKRQHKTYL